MRKYNILLAIYVLILFFSAESFSAIKTWTGSTSTDWSVGSNWLGGTAPVLNDDIIIPFPVSRRNPEISTSVNLGNGTITINYMGNSNVNAPPGAFLTLTTGGSLTTNGQIIVNKSGTFIVIDGTASLNGITSSGKIDIQGGTITSKSNIILSSGDLYQSGGIVWMAKDILTNPTDNLLIKDESVFVNQSGGTFYTKDFGPEEGTFYQTGSNAEFRVFHDWKPNSNHTFISTDGTVRFSGNSGADAAFNSTNTQFYNVVVDALMDPGFDNKDNSFLKISGNLINNNTNLSTNNKVSILFNGSEDQYITSNSASMIYNLTLDKPFGTLTLASDIIIAGTITMSSGNIITGANSLTLGTGTAVTGTLQYSSGIIVTGTSGGFKRWFKNTNTVNVLFPVGTSSTINMIKLSFVGAPTAGGSLTAKFMELDPGINYPGPLDDAGYPLDSYSQAGYWQLDAANGLTGGTYNLSLRGQGFNRFGNGITNYSKLRILKRANGRGPTGQYPAYTLMPQVQILTQ